MILSETEKRTRKVKWSPERIITLINECRKSGREFAEKRLAELRKAGPQWNVINENTNQVIDQMLDVCGYANLHISARGKFFQLAKKMSNGYGGLRFHCDNAYGGGGGISIFDTSMRQEMSVNVAACRGIQEVLAKYGIESTIQSRID